MVIGIDARFAIKSRRGIGNYSLNLINNLKKIDRVNTYILYTDSPDNGVLPNSGNFKVKILKALNYVIWEQILLPYHLRRDNINIMHCLGNTGPILLPQKVKLILTLHDIMFLKDDLRVYNLFDFLAKQYRSFIVKKIINNVYHIITVSEFSKNDIINFFNIAPSDITVTWESYNESLIKEKFKQRLESQPYILCLGANDPRKNTIMAIEIFDGLIKKGYNGKLIIIGFKNWTNSKAHKLVKNMNLLNQVIFRDYITDADLMAYYKFATLFLYPSTYEGFGIPPLEAMACGCPVVASNITSIPEITLDSALLVFPLLKDNFINACFEIIQNDKIKQQLIKKGLKRVTTFSWLKMSKQTLNIYKKISENS